MEIFFKRNTALPQLAWCARFRPGNPLVEVEHGTGVGTCGDFFYEGAWNGGFHAEDYLAASVVVGTGGAVSGNRIHFVPSSDRLCPLFSISNASGTTVSNSPVFAMASADEQLDPLYPFYFYDFVRIWRMGLHCPAGLLRLASGNRLNVHFFTKLMLGEQGGIVCHPHSPGPKPEDYQSYHTILLEGLRGVFSNGSDQRRTQVLRPLAAISRGYDSTASACLAAQAGCREAYSFVDSRREDRNRDSGKANAALLGLECSEYDRWEHQRMPGVADAEFAMLGSSVLVTLAALGEKLPGKLLVTGDHGDILWSPVESGCCENLTIPWARFLAGVGHLEFRLRTGFHLIAPAYIGARYSPEIHRITYSDEMKPWWVEGSYNRPIARRIAEESGLSRDQFGFRKYASGHSSYRNGTGFNTEGHQAYLEYVRSRDAALGGLKRLYWKKRHKLRRFLWKRFSSKVRIYRNYVWWRRYVPYLFTTCPNEFSWTYQFTFQWSAQVLRSRYSRVHAAETVDFPGSP